MWTTLSHFVLKFRVLLLVLLVLVTAFMAYMGQYLKWSFDLMKIVPDDDPAMVDFRAFRQKFGEDANVMAIGIEDSAVYEVANFQAFHRLGHTIKELDAVTSLISLAELQVLTKDRKNKRFELETLFKRIPQSKAEQDSLVRIAKQQKIYEGYLFNPENGAVVIILSIKESVLNSRDRLALMDEIVGIGDQFEQETGITLHYAGLPYVRSVMFKKVKAEMNMFLGLSLLITAVILFLFFRSVTAVILPLIVIGMVVVWVLGTLAILGFKVTMLTGLLPPILVVIGIPNSVYLLNKFHQEFANHGNKIKALSRVIRKIGIVTLITNATTAIGFLVLIFTGIQPLVEFGIVAGINIMATFLISIILLPAAYSFLPPPKTKHIKHLDFPIVNAILESFIRITERHRNMVYAVVGLLALIFLYGTFQIRAIQFMVDDVPEDGRIKRDLVFFERNFKGIMPLEILVNTGQPKGYRRRGVMEHVDSLQTALGELPFVTQPLSMVTFLKAANQAYFDTPLKFTLPNKREMPMIYRYLRNQDSTQADRAKSFVDTSGQYLRISMQMADVGSAVMDTLITNTINPIIQKTFEDTELTASVTGTSVIFVKGNDFLINNLRNSMLIAFLLIAVIMGLLFRNVRMIIISLIPNLIPLLITAGIMGFSGIPLKPSTALVFSIAFGISVDDSIHFLAKYRQELLQHRGNLLIAIPLSLRETGKSMIYTSIILFFGFVIFAASDFGGTVALGKLTSITLLIAMFTNLILLPCLLRSFGVNRIQMQYLLEKMDEELEMEEKKSTKSSG